jgi:hypothetical protein
VHACGIRLLSCVPFCFSWIEAFCESESGLHSVTGTNWNPTPIFNSSLMLSNKCLKKGNVLCNIGYHAIWGPRKMSNTWNISKGPLEVCLLSNFTIRPTTLNSSWCFAQNIKITNLQASIGSKANMQDHDSRKHLALKMLSCVEEDKICLDRLCFSHVTTFNMCGVVNRHICHVWEVKILMIHWRLMCHALHEKVMSFFLKNLW